MQSDSFSFDSIIINCFYHTFQSLSKNQLTDPAFDIGALHNGNENLFYGYLNCGDLDENKKPTVISYRNKKKFLNKRAAKAETALEYLENHKQFIDKQLYKFIDENPNWFEQQKAELNKLAKADVASEEEEKKLHKDGIKLDENGEIIVTDGLDALEDLRRRDKTIDYIITRTSKTCLQGTLKYNNSSYNINYSHTSTQFDSYCKRQLAMQLLRQLSIINPTADQVYRKLNPHYCFVKGEQCHLEECQTVEFKSSGNPGAYVTCDKAKEIIKTHGPKTLCAFLNTENGGSLYIGIHDDDRIVQGVLLNSKERDEIKQQMIHHLCQLVTPSVPTNFTCILHPVTLKPISEEVKLAKSQLNSIDLSLSKAEVKSTSSSTPSPQVMALQSQVDSLRKTLQRLDTHSEEKQNNKEAFVIEFRISGTFVTHWASNIAYERVDNQSRPMSIDSLKKRIREERV